MDDPLLLSSEPTATHMMMEHDVEIEEASQAASSDELYAPLTWGPVPMRVALSIVLLPFIGLFWAKFAVGERIKKRVVGYNPQDWLVILFIGVTHQLAVIGFIATMVHPGYILCNFPTDYWGTAVFYPASFGYMLSISYTYHCKKIEGSGRTRALNENVTRTRVQAMRLLEGFRQETAFPVLLLLPFCIALSVIILLILRLCLDSCSWTDANGQPDGTWTRFDVPMNSACSEYHSLDSKHQATTHISFRYQSVDFNVMNVFWCLLSSSTTCCCIYAAILFFQQVRQIEEFTYIKKYAGKRQFLRDINDFSKDVAVWASVWQELIQSLNNRPMCRAFISSSAAVSFLLWLVSALYIVFQTVLQNLKVGELTTAAAALLGFNTFALFFFIYIAVRMQRTIEYQVKSVSAAQNDLQRQIDENKTTMEREEMLQKMSNCRVLAALDVYLTVFDNTPKVVGSISLESMRWIALLGGLFCMNVFFFALYVSNCYEGHLSQ